MCRLTIGRTDNDKCPSSARPVPVYRKCLCCKGVSTADGLDGDGVYFLTKNGDRGKRSKERAFRNSRVVRPARPPACAASHRNMTQHQIRTFLALVRWQRMRHPRSPYPLFEVMRALRADAATTALALKFNGWQRDRLRATRSNRRQLTTWWVPPNGQPVKRRRRGRPSFADLLSPDYT